MGNYDKNDVNFLKVSNMKNIKFLIPIFILISCSTSNVRETDLDKFKLKGKVKLLEQVTYRPESKFGKIVKGERLDLTFEVCEFEKTFNEKGFITEIDLYNASHDFLEKDIYLYSENNFLKEKNNYKPNGLLAGKIIYQYNETMTAGSFTGYDSDGKVNYHGTNSFIIDESGKMEVLLHNNDSLIRNSKGLVVKKISKGFDGLLYQIHEYKYDENENEIEKLTYNKNNSLTLKINYEYDKYGNSIKLIGESFYGSESTTSIYEDIYTYDNKGNWSTKVMYKDGQANLYIERNIQYYK